MLPLARTLSSVPDQRILVLGDLILDRYIEGDVSRVSPEAPVLIFETNDHRFRLGGACNVAANLVGLGAHASMLGVVGEDAAAQQLRDLLQEVQIDVAPMVEDPSRPTTRKTRYTNRTAQVLRVDEESRAVVTGPALQAMLDFLGQRPFPFDAILISDYGKGVVSRQVVEAAVAAAHSAGGVVVVDPKGADYSVYQGVDLLTPNREEAIAATGIELRQQSDLHRVAERLKEITGIKTATVTLGKDGIFFENEDGQPHIIPTEARAVFDVTGAGDTVVAVLTLLRSAGVSMDEAVRLANLAAGLVVARFGTHAVTRQELLGLLGNQKRGKVLSLDDAAAVAAELRANGQRLVFTNGCFDILHPGHTDYLQRARAYGEALMVAVNDDESVRRQAKGADRPINTLVDRMEVLAALAAVDFVVAFGQDTPEELIRALTPDVLVKGEDWRDKGVVGREWVESHGGQVVLVPLREGCSTTGIIQRIRSRNA